MRTRLARLLRLLADGIALEPCDGCGAGVATSTGTPICSYCYDRQIKDEAQEKAEDYLSRRPA